MEAIKCDGCGKVSPDKDGLHIANHWTEISVNSPWRRRNRYAKPEKHTFCRDCISYKEGGDPESNIVREFFVKMFKGREL